MISTLIHPSVITRYAAFFLGPVHSKGFNDPSRNRVISGITRSLKEPGHSSRAAPLREAAESVITYLSNTHKTAPIFLQDIAGADTIYPNITHPRT